jgi:hypothetical protein
LDIEAVDGEREKRKSEHARLHRTEASPIENSADIDDFNHLCSAYGCR